MILQCGVKGCYSEDTHLLDTSTNEVYCIKCGNPLNLPQTTKKVLKDMGQISRAIKTGGIQIKCKKCGQTTKPLLKKLSGNIHIATCRGCKEQLEMHQSFIMAMQDIGEEYLTEKETLSDEPAPATPIKRTAAKPKSGT